MTYRWGFTLINFNWVEALSWNLFGPDVAIFREEEDGLPAVFTWSSPHFSELKADGRLLGRATALKRLFDGGLYLERGPGFYPEKLGDLVDLTTGRFATAYGVTTEEQPFSTSICKHTLTSQEHARVQGGLLEAALFVARRDKSVRGLLEMLGHSGVSFISLYAIKDSLRTHGFDEARIARLAGCDKTEVGLFRRTANSFEALGPMARHGECGWEPPTDTMTLERAAEIILPAAQAFVWERLRLGAEKSAV